MNQPQIRLATKEDLPALIDLWAYCFNDSDVFRNWYFKYYYRQDECIVASIDGVTVASLQVIDLPTRVGEQSIAAGYIVGVDCLPEYRGHGLTKRLMEEAMQRFAPEKGYQILHLMPFEADFYESFGFVYGEYHANMILPIEEFYRPDYRVDARSHHWGTVDLNRYDDVLPLLEALYQQSMNKQDGYVERQGKRRWSALLDDVRLEDGYCKILYNDNNEAVGYLVYILQDDILLIRELQAVNAAARKAMYYFIAAHRSQVKQVRWSAAENEPIIYQRKKDKQGVQFYPFMMNTIIEPTVIGEFATHIPQDDLYFYVEKKGYYHWHKQSSIIEACDIGPMNVVRLTLEDLSKMVFARNEWEDETVSVQQMQMSALFKEKKRIFNNEYF